MKLIIGNWCFHPRLITTLLAAIFFILFLWLGLWQLDRAEYKRELHKEYLSNQSAPPVALDAIIPTTNLDLFLWRHVFARGQFLESKQVLLDNQVQKSTAGYFVYTPFQLHNSDVWVLVNRGWLASPSHRSEVPPLTPELTGAESTVHIKGVLKHVPKTGIQLEKTEPENMTDEIIRVQNIDIKQLEVVLDKKLLPVILRLDANSDHGYLRNWRLPGSGEETHMGYAYQWFAFATLLCCLYIGLNIKKLGTT